MSVGVCVCVCDFLLKVGLWNGIDMKVMSGIYGFCVQLCYLKDRAKKAVMVPDHKPGISQPPDCYKDLLMISSSNTVSQQSYILPFSSDLTSN